MNEITSTFVDWSRAQFALTAMYHWIFVPLTLGLAVLMSIMETVYYRTGDTRWKQITQFWMNLFAVNFAIGVATGIILEFQFGTNWSNYSWFVGDIFGAPLAIEGMMAFFMEAIFGAVMFFGWNKVSKGFHLTATWMTTLGATLSALWILVANAWMQHPVGMRFNPETVRNEMMSFSDLITSPVAINKFLHTVTSAWVVGAVFVVAVSCWYLIKKRNNFLALKSVKIGSIFGIIALTITIITGDDTAKVVARVQPMKLAAMEGLYEGDVHQSIVAFGILNPKKRYDNDEKTFLFAIRIPDVLSFLAYGDTDAYVAGINDIIKGNYLTHGLDRKYFWAEPYEDKIESGKLAIQSLQAYREEVELGMTQKAQYSVETLNANYDNFGYGYFDDIEDLIPNVPIVFYAFHIMVLLGCYFLLYFFAVYYFVARRQHHGKHRWMMYIGLWSLPLVYIMSQAGWVTAEVGRQPWTIQDILPTKASVSDLAQGNVETTFWMFAALFTILLIADIWIMVKQIKKVNIDSQTGDQASY